MIVVVQLGKGGLAELAYYESNRPSINGENFKSRFYKYSKRQHKHNHINGNRLAQEDDDDDMTDSLCRRQDEREQHCQSSPQGRAALQTSS